MHKLTEEQKQAYARIRGHLVVYSMVMRLSKTDAKKVDDDLDLLLKVKNG